MITILLPTYNGAKYIEQQIDSIIFQTYTDWILLIRDDMSIDETVAIIKRYCLNYPLKIHLIEDEKGNLGTTKSIDLLLMDVKTDYFMFCDQDDVWKEDKIERTMQQMKIAELDLPDTPILVCTDAECINKDNEIISTSFFDSQKFFDVVGSEIKMMALNIVQGSTCLLNKKCLDYILPIPKSQFHDFWIAVIVAHYGKVFYLKEQTLCYRQHSNNVVGALSIDRSYFFSKIIAFRKYYCLLKDFFSNLPFRVNLFKWFFYKLYYTIRRML